MAAPGEAAEPTPEVSASATPSPTATRDLPVPELSELGKEFSQEGSGAFAIYYVQVLNYSRNSGDVEVLRSISAPDCAACDDDVREVSFYLAHGYSHDGLETQFRKIEFGSWEPATGDSQMQVYVDRPAHSVIDRGGTVIDEAPGATDASFYLWLKWVDNHWLVWEAQ
nr:DUF6318 family protein [Kineococcus aurantiacus]